MRGASISPFDPKPTTDEAITTSDCYGNVSLPLEVMMIAPVNHETGLRMQNGKI